LAAAAKSIAEPADSVSQRPDSICEEADSNSEENEYNPFISFAFLSILEESGCVGPRTGWTPRHLVVERAGRVVAVAPCYAKGHSQGEYVFDHSWADAYQRAGGDYYPKFQLAVPFSPVPGRRLLVAPGEPVEETRRALGQAIRMITDRSGFSSAHITFLGEAEAATLEGEGFLRRADQQFHWHNKGYGTFEDFLGDLASRKRKMIARERREAVAAGITIERLTGADLKEAHWDAFHAFYEDTGARKWGRPYLNRRFFSLLGERLAGDVVLVLASREGRPIAGALNLAGSHALFGRNWGATEHHPFLHFEVCYYQAIEHAIVNRLPRVEAGAQGEHKLARGYLPRLTHSAHHIPDPGFRAAVARYLERERLAVGEMVEEMTDLGPFRKVIASAGT
jgi:uncharacterized protein